MHISRTYLPALWLFVALSYAHVRALASLAELSRLRNETRDLLLHGFNGYMDFAFPHDELSPLTCVGRSKDPDVLNLGINDICGGFSMTLIDSLDSLAVIGDRERFETGVRNVIAVVDFDQDSKVQVFEVSIRVLGGLLSAHQLASGEIALLGMRLDWYSGELLDLAVDLGSRLLQAFDTPTGIPRPRVNLQSGTAHFAPSETNETCAAGAGSLILEFALLSRLSGIPAFEAAARKAFQAVWSRRLDLGLVGSAIDSQTGQWLNSYTSVGASVDSFYEYALKAWILLGDDYYLDVWQVSSQAIQDHIVDDSGFLLRTVHVQNGFPLASHVDSLSAFYPGLLVLAGELEQAVKLHFTYAALWKRYRAIPERYDYVNKAISLPFYPLRPEFVESTYLLYRATKDPYYLDLGRQILHDLKALKTECGFAGLGDVTTGRLEDRMESFMLSETLKYLFLLFDDGNPLHGNRMRDPWVLSTEGHMLSMPNASRALRSSNVGQSTALCKPPPQKAFFSTALSRSDYFHPNIRLGLLNSHQLVNDTERPAADAFSSIFVTSWTMELLFGNLLDLAAFAGVTLLTAGKDIVVKSLRGLKLNLELKGNKLAITFINKQPLLKDSRVLVHDPGYRGYSQAAIKFAPDWLGTLRIIKEDHEHVDISYRIGLNDGLPESSFKIFPQLETSAANVGGGSSSDVVSSSVAVLVMQDQIAPDINRHALPGQAGILIVVESPDMSLVSENQAVLKHFAEELPTLLIRYEHLAHLQNAKALTILRSSCRLWIQGNKVENMDVV